MFSKHTSINNTKCFRVWPAYDDDFTLFVPIHKMIDRSTDILMLLYVEIQCSMENDEPLKSAGISVSGHSSPPPLPPLTRARP